MILEEGKKTGFFDQIIYSVQPAKYKELVKQPVRKLVFYILILGICLNIMDFVIPTAGWLVSFGGMDHLIMEVLPKIELKQGELTVGNKIEIGKEEGFHLLVDTSRDTVKLEQMDNAKYMAEILIGKKNMLIYNSLMGTMEVDFSRHAGVNLTNQSILEMKPLIYMTMVMSFFSNLFGEIIRYLFAALPLAAIGWAFGGPDRKNRMNFSRIYMLALYAKTAAALFLSFNASVNLISNQALLVYGGLFLTMYLLMTGVRRTEEETA